MYYHREKMLQEELDELNRRIEMTHFNQWFNGDFSEEFKNKCKKARKEKPFLESKLFEIEADLKSIINILNTC